MVVATRRPRALHRRRGARACTCRRHRRRPAGERLSLEHRLRPRPARRLQRPALDHPDQRGPRRRGSRHDLGDGLGTDGLRGHRGHLQRRDARRGRDVLDHRRDARGRRRPLCRRPRRPGDGQCNATRRPPRPDDRGRVAQRHLPVVHRPPRRVAQRHVERRQRARPHAVGRDRLSPRDRELAQGRHEDRQGRGAVQSRHLFAELERRRLVVRVAPGSTRRPSMACGPASRARRQTSTRPGSGWRRSGAGASRRRGRSGSGATRTMAPAPGRPRSD